MLVGVALPVAMSRYMRCLVLEIFVQGKHGKDLVVDVATDTETVTGLEVVKYNAFIAVSYKG